MNCLALPSPSCLTIVSYHLHVCVYAFVYSHNFTLLSIYIFTWVSLHNHTTSHMYVCVFMCVRFIYLIFLFNFFLHLSCLRIFFHINLILISYLNFTFIHFYIAYYSSIILTIIFFSFFAIAHLHHYYFITSIISPPPLNLSISHINFLLFIPVWLLQYRSSTSANQQVCEMRQNSLQSGGGDFFF